MMTVNTLLSEYSDLVDISYITINTYIKFWAYISYPIIQMNEGLSGSPADSFD